MTENDRDKIVAKLQFFYDYMMAMESDIQAFSMYIDDLEEKKAGRHQVEAIEKLLSEYVLLFERFLHV